MPLGSCLAAGIPPILARHFAWQVRVRILKGRKAGDEAPSHAEFASPGGGLAADGRTLWAEKLGGSVDDVFGMQERISRTIVDALKITLSSAEGAAAPRASDQ